MSFCEDILQEKRPFTSNLTERAEKLFRAWQKQGKGVKEWKNPAGQVKLFELMAERNLRKASHQPNSGAKLA